MVAVYVELLLYSKKLSSTQSHQSVLGYTYYVTTVHPQLKYLATVSWDWDKKPGLLE
jgi:hypothetical protein